MLRAGRGVQQPHLDRLPGQLGRVHLVLGVLVGRRARAAPPPPPVTAAKSTVSTTRAANRRSRPPGRSWARALPNGSAATGRHGVTPSRASSCTCSAQGAGVCAGTAASPCGEGWDQAGGSGGVGCGVTVGCRYGGRCAACAAGPAGPLGRGAPRRWAAARCPAAPCAGTGQAGGCCAAGAGGGGATGAGAAGDARPARAPAAGPARVPPGRPGPRPGPPGRRPGTSGPTRRPRAARRAGGAASGAGLLVPGTQRGAVPVADVVRDRRVRVVPGAGDADDEEPGEPEGGALMVHRFRICSAGVCSVQIYQTGGPGGTAPPHTTLSDTSLPPHGAARPLLPEI